MILSVVVPAGPGETEWERLLPQLAAGLPAGSELLLVTAGPAVAKPSEWPETVAWVALGDHHGRAGPLNEAARLARGEWLWFLHADSRLRPETIPALLRFMAQDETALGWFDLAFRPDGPRLVALNAWGANLRSAWLGMPFGDQGFVLKATCFAALGGFDEAARYGEDHLLAWSARHAGVPLRRVGAPLLTSARKYGRRGWAATTLRHVWLTALQAWPEWRRWRRSRRRK